MDRLAAIALTLGVALFCFAMAYVWRRPSPRLRRYAQIDDRTQAGPVGQAGQVVWVLFGCILVLAAAVNVGHAVVTTAWDIVP